MRNYPLKKISIYVIIMAIILPFFSSFAWLNSLADIGEDVVLLTDKETRGVVPVSFTIPEVFDGDGFVAKEDYPTVTKPVAKNSETAQHIYDENERIMNADFLEDAVKNKTLKKHFHADTMFGAISDSAPRVKKDIIIKKNEFGEIATGLYAPAGEIVTFYIPQELVRGISVVFSPHTIDIKKEKDLVRMPKIRYETLLYNTEPRLGTYFGGAITLFFADKNFFDATPREEDWTVTISGAVEMPHFKLHTNTQQDWSVFKTFHGRAVHLTTDNLSIIMHVTDSIRNIENPEIILSYYESVLAMQDSITQFGKVRTSRMKLYFDSYVSVGIACAWVGSNFCQFNQSDAKIFLSIENVLTNGGWTVFHEMGHHHQHYEFKEPWTVEPQEVAVNVMSILSTKYFTTLIATKLENELKGNHMLTDYHYAIIKGQQAGRSLETKSDYLELTNGYELLSFWGILLGRFSVSEVREFFSTYNKKLTDNSMQNKKDEMLIRMSQTFKYDFTLYFDFYKFNNSFKAKETVASLKYPVFYPVASIYSSGDYIIKNAETKTFDFNSGTISLFGDFVVEEVKIEGNNNTWVNKGNNIYEFTPNFESHNADIILVKVKTPVQTLVLKSTIRAVDKDTPVLDFYDIYNFNVNPSTKDLTVFGDSMASVFVAEINDDNVGGNTNNPNGDKHLKIAIISVSCVALGLMVVIVVLIFSKRDRGVSSKTHNKKDVRHTKNNK